MTLSKQRSFRIRRRLGATTEILRQKAFHRCIECHIVFRNNEPMALIRENVILDRLTIGTHGCDNLVALWLLDAGIVRTLADQQRRLDLISLEQRRL